MEEMINAIISQLRKSDFATVYMIYVFVTGKS